MLWRLLNSSNIVANSEAPLVESTGPGNSVTYTGEANVHRSLAIARIRPRDGEYQENPRPDAGRQEQIRLGARSQVDAIYEIGRSSCHHSQLGRPHPGEGICRCRLRADAGAADLEKGIARRF